MRAGGRLKTQTQQDQTQTASVVLPCTQELILTQRGSETSFRLESGWERLLVLGSGWGTGEGKQFSKVEPFSFHTVFAEKKT